MTDHSSLLPVSAPLAHFLEFFCLHGPPANGDAARPVSIIVNHGYALGFCPARLQPLWAAYQVSAATRDVDYERPEMFYDDPRLPPDWQVGTKGYGKVDGIGHDRGHLVPNYAINTQFGRVAQFETFFMSNIAPQRAGMNRGIWQRLEKQVIRAYAPERKQVLAITGPTFGPDPALLKRRGGLLVPVPDSFFLILADPERYPFESPDNLDILALEVPQALGPEPIDDRLISSLPVLEAKTGLTFFPRLSAKEKDKLITHTSPLVWPFHAMAPTG